MAIRANRFNDPALGEAFGNLASIFAPPSAQDLVGYTTANAKRQEAERLAWLFANPNDPLADRKATMAGVYAPTQSYYAVDQNTATTRRGQDVTASTDLEKQRIAGQYGLAGQFMTPLNPGQVQPGLPADVAGSFGVPALPRTEGTPKPLSLEEQKAVERAQLRERGTLTDTMLLDSILGADAPVKTVSPDGTPIYSTPGAAARTGAPAYVDAGSQPAKEIVILRNSAGETVRGYLDKSSGITRLEDGSVAPPDYMPFNVPSTQGTPAETGLGTNANVTLGQRTVALADYATSRASQYEKFLATNPGVTGLPAVVQGFAQDLAAGVSELAAVYGDKAVPSEVITNLTDQVTKDNGYNPAIREALNRAAELAYIQAQLGDPGGEVNVKEWERLYGQFIGNMGGNAAVAGPLRAFQEQAAARRIYGQNLISGNKNAYPDLPLPGATPAAPTAGGSVLSPDDLKYLETP